MAQQAELDIDEGLVKRHPDFYYEDLAGKAIIIQCQDTLYRLLKDPLIRRSVIFRDMFDCNPDSDVKEGESDNFPLKLYYILSRDFDHLCAYIFLGTNGEMVKEESLISIMKLSKLWIIKDGVKFVLDFLSLCPTFRPALHLYFAFHYGQLEWIEPAFKALVKIPLRRLTEHDAILLGPTVMWILTTTVSDLQNDRQKLAYTWPKLVECPFWCYENWHERCEERWQIYWLTEVSTFLLYPGNSKNTYADLKEKLRTHDFEKEVSGNLIIEHCVRETLEGSVIAPGGLLNKPDGRFFYDTDRVDEAVTLLRNCI